MNDLTNAMPVRLTEWKNQDCRCTIRIQRTRRIRSCTQICKRPCGRKREILLILENC